MHFELPNQAPVYTKLFMKLPLTISPCPIAETVVELRFETDTPEEAVFGTVYHALKKDFPKSSPLPMAAVPPEVRRADPNLIHQPLHRLIGDNLTILIGPQAVTVGTVGEYPGWAAAAERFRDTFMRIANTGLIGRPLRFGLRYINFFSGDVLPNLTLSIAIDGHQINGSGTHLKTMIQAEGCQILLQIGKDLMLVGEENKTGSVIDIDTFVTAPEAEGRLDNALSEFMETAHLAEKKLFFNLLKPEFLETLNPAYPNAARILSP